MKIEFTQTIGAENRIKSMIGTAQVIGDKLVCTGRGEKLIDAILHGDRELDKVHRALETVTIVFNTAQLKAEWVED